jgi:hypothetical protein
MATQSFLATEQGISQIREFMEHLYHDTDPGKMIKISLQTLQADAGSATHILQDPTVQLSYCTPCWITSSRQFMGSNQLAIQMTKPWNFFLSRKRDAYLMDIFRFSGLFSPYELKHLNAVRFYLQVATVADIATADGGYIQEDYIAGRRNSSRVSRWSWPRQPEITKHQQGLWKKACRLTILQTAHKPHCILGTNLRLNIQLGRWTSERNQHWEFTMIL